MAGRIRSIKPEVLEDEVSASLSDASWRLWVSMWVLADDHGLVRAGVKYLAASVWLDTSRDAEAPLFELIEKGLVRPYSVNGQRYVEIRGWKSHQRVDNAGKPRVPVPEDDDGTWNQTLTEKFSTTRGEDSRVSNSCRSTTTTTTITDHDHRPPTDNSSHPAGADEVSDDVGQLQLAPDEPPNASKADVVHEYFLEVRKRHNPRARTVALVSKDRKGIDDALRRGFTVEDLKLACDGLFLSPHHLGENDRHTSYLEFRYVLKNVEKFIALAEEHGPREAFVDAATAPRELTREEHLAQMAKIDALKAKFTSPIRAMADRSDLLGAIQKWEPKGESK